MTAGPRSSKRQANAAAKRRYSPGIVVPEQIQDDLEAAERSLLGDGPQSQRYPERNMPIAGTEPRAEMWSTDEVPAPVDEAYQAALDRYELFSAARERLLINYKHNTARAYWGDLDDIFFWCEHRRLDIFDLTDRDLRQYKGLLRRRKYSENTIRRREVTYRLFWRVVDAEQ